MSRKLKLIVAFSLLIIDRRLFRDTVYTHFSPLLYVAPCVFGLFVGRAIVCKVTLPAHSRAVGWFLFCCSWVVILSSVTVKQSAVSDELKYAHASLMRLSVGYETSWVYFALSRGGGGGIMHKTLSSSVVVPLARISLSTTMSHFVFIWLMNFTETRPLEYYLLGHIRCVLSTVVISYAIGYTVHVCVVAPFTSLMESVLL